MRSFLIELARLGGKIALEHFQTTGISVSAKGRGDYVSHVDRRVEDALFTRIAYHHRDDLLLGEETHGHWPSEVEGPCWIIDPIDGTTNFLRGLPGWAVSICYCDADARPRHAVVFDPLRDEIFVAERGAGLWLNEERVYTSGCKDLGQAIVSQSMPFRTLDALDDVAAVIHRLQPKIDDMRRSGSAALDCAYVAAGRSDAYWELGIHPWDVAAGELLIQCGGGKVSDFRGESGELLGRRSVVAAATPDLHGQLLAEVGGLASWLDHPAYRGA